MFLLGITFSLSAQSVRERILLDDGWQFAFGNASSPEKDFGCGTEYFNYLTKAASIHNEGPYSPKFNPEKWGVAVSYTHLELFSATDKPAEVYYRSAQGILALARETEPEIFFLACRCV